MILLTTSHRPTKGIRTLCHDLMSSIPGLTQINRGKMSLYEVAEKAAELGSEKIVIIDRWKGGPGRIRFFKMGESGATQVSPQIYISGIRLKREFKVTRKPVRSLFINGTNENDQVERLKENLSNFFGISIMDFNEATEKYQAVMRFSMEPSSLLIVSFYKMPNNIEIGPRITVSHVVWNI